MDKFVLGILVFMSLMLGVAIYFSSKYEEKAEAQAKVIGCEYLGSARDMRSVGFYECGDTIVLKKIK